MTTYTATDLSGLIAAFFDPDSPTVTFKKINGVDIDWVTLAGAPHVVALTKGSIRIYQNGKTNPPVYDDGGSTSGHPQPGATLANGSVTYTLTDGATEVGPFTMSFTNSGVATVPPPAPLQNTVAPTISGATTVGSTLTRTAGTWTGNGTVVVTGRWTQDNVNIPGETGATYVTVAGDVGKTIRYVEDATDDTPASSSAASNGIGITPITLANTAPPTFSGTPTVGSTLTYAAGSWVGTGTITKSVDAWLRDGTPIAGATGNTYVLVGADQGTQISVREEATDSLTSATATSTSATVSPASTINAQVLRSNVDDEFATDPEKGWTGFPAGTSMTVQTATHPDQVKSFMDAWATGTPSTSKLDIVCDWNGLVANSSLRWFGPTSGKLTSDPSSLYGYSLGTGGVRLRAAAGKTPIFDRRLEITGVTRLEIDGVRFAGKRDGITNGTAYALKFTRTGTYPTIGLVALKNTSIGHYDNRGSSLVQADICHGFHFGGARSTYIYNVRGAGLATVFLGASEYFKAELIDIQQANEDCFAIRGYTGALASRVAWIRVKNVLARDSRLIATGAHPDLVQLGSTTDTSHVGYRYAYDQLMAHLRVDTAADGGSQGFYNDDTPSPAKFEGSAYRAVVGLNAYHGFSMWDPSQAGHNHVEEVAFYRSGSTGLSVDSYPWVNVPHGTSGGGSRKAKNCTMTTINGGAQATLQLEDIRYCSPRKNRAASQNGLTASTAKRFEEVVAGTGGTISRDGSDFLTYSIPGESNPDSAVAFEALRDFYTPLAGWGTTGQPADPLTWPGMFGN